MHAILAADRKRLPFKGQNARETMDAHCKASRPSLDRFSKRNWHVIQLDALIRKLFAIDPEDRPSSMEDVINQLTAIADESVRRKQEAEAHCDHRHGICSCFCDCLIRAVFDAAYLQFDLGSVYDEREVQTLVNLKDQISQVRDWHSGVSEQLATDLTDDPANPERHHLQALHESWPKQGPSKCKQRFGKAVRTGRRRDSPQLADAVQRSLN